MYPSSSSSFSSPSSSASSLSSSSSAASVSFSKLQPLFDQAVNQNLSTNVFPIHLFGVPCWQIDNLLHTLAETGLADNFFSFLNASSLRIRNAKGQTPIHMAIVCGRIDILRGLLERELITQNKADAVLIDKGPFLLDFPAYALAVDRPEVYDLFVQHGLIRSDQWTFGLGNFLHVAAYYGAMKGYEYLSKQSQFLGWGDQLNEVGQTPMHVAASQGHYRLLAPLYGYFPRSLEKVDAQGLSPIQAAALAFKPRCVELIVALGCKREYFDAALNALKKDGSPSAQAMVDFMKSLQLSLEEPQRRQNYRQCPIEYVALAGGGAKGLVEIGVLDEVEQRLGYKPNVSGTSLGAITASLYAVGYFVKELEENFVSKNFLEFMDGLYELKELKFSHLPASHPFFETTKKLFSIFAELKEFVAAPAIYGSERAKATMRQLTRVAGLCEGRALQEWVEQLIFEKTGVHNLTFGELAGLGEKPGTSTRHLFLTITCFGEDADALLYPNTIDPEWKDHIVSHMVRASAGYPGVFSPSRLWTKDQDGNPRCVDESRLVCGGILSNGGASPLDEVRLESVFNRALVAVAFTSPRAQSIFATELTILELLEELVDTAIQAEAILSTNPYHKTRLIKVPVETGSTSSAMVQEGRKAASAFFAKRTQQIVAVQNSLAALSLALPRFAHFSGRDSQLKQLAEALVVAAAGWRPEHKTREALLYGSEGMGKSSLAAAFADAHADHFKFIWTINCHDLELQARSYKKLAGAVGISFGEDEAFFSIIDKVHRYLESLVGPWLLVFDDVTELPERPRTGGAVLFISRVKVDDPGLTATVRLGTFELSDVEELVVKRLGAKDRELATRLCSEYSSNPELIEQSVRRMAEASTPKKYSHRLAEPLSPIVSQVEFRQRSSAIDEFLELLAYLREIPQGFLQEYVSKHGSLSCEEVRRCLFDAGSIRCGKEGTPLAIRSATLKQLIEAHKKEGLDAAKFTAAFQALEAWAVQDGLKRGGACVLSRTHAVQEMPALWEQCPAVLRSSLCRIAGSWLVAEKVPYMAITLLEEALALCSDEAIKGKIEADLRFAACEVQRAILATLHEKHERLPALIGFATYLSHIPLSFLPYWLGVPSAQADQLFTQLVRDLLVREQKNKKFIELKTDPRKAFLQIFGGLQQSSLDAALEAFAHWLRLDTFNLLTDGEGCVACTNDLSRDRDLALLWNRSPAEHRVEMYACSAQWLNLYGEDLKGAMEAYEDALAICIDARRHEELSAEKAALARKLADLAQRTTSVQTSRHTPSSSNRAFPPSPVVVPDKPGFWRSLFTKKRN